MLKFTHRTLVIFSGMIWLGVGAMLLNLGLNFLVDSALSVERRTAFILPHLTRYVGGVQEAAMLIVVLCVLVGFLKGRFVLARTVQRGVKRISLLPNPTSIFSIYGVGTYCLLALMMGLGMVMRFLQFPLDLRGAVDIAVGAALINGAVLYFRVGFGKKAVAKE